MGLGFGSSGPRRPSIDRPELERELRVLEKEIIALEAELAGLPAGSPNADGIRAAIAKRKARVSEIRRILGY